MWFKNLLQSLASTTSRRRSSARLCLEALEDRCVLSYSVIDLGSLGGNVTLAYDINASGQVVGTSSLANGVQRPFLWQNGVMTDLGTLGEGYGSALGINDAGQIVGFTDWGNAFLLTPEDTDGNGAPDCWFRDSDSDGKNDLMLDLGLGHSEANDVNNAGQVVGILRPGTTNPQGFFWENGTLTELPVLSADAINDAGQVTGIAWATGEPHAFLWQGGVMYDIGASSYASPPWWPRSTNDINQSGQVAGALYPSNFASLWTPTTPNGTTGSFQSLGVLPPDRWELVLYEDSTATGVNDFGTVVGTSHTAYLYPDPEAGYFDIFRAFVWADGVMEALPLTRAAAINNAGQIVGNVPMGARLLTPVDPAHPLISIDDVTVSEGNNGTRAATLTVTLSAASSQPVTIAYATGNGTATAGSDYQPASDTLTFAGGETSKTIIVLVNCDAIFEPDETFYVNLSNVSGATIADGQGVGTIVNDDVALPSLTVSDVSKKEGNSGTTEFRFTVTLSARSNVPVTVQYATADGTATVSGRDYYAKSGTLTFQPGQTSKTVTVSVRGDRTQEAHETFFLNLANSQGATIADGQGLGTIQNDDGGSSSAWAALINDLALSSTSRKRR